ncbi:phage tail tube protein [Devosia sp. 1635]|uniref:phage tail tube protein n=1 Tax=Devosia sp. 1635 TaxID=2726066 RepID=UPI0015678379|nr:phage tail tube protein [Devosia sp. 1635]
MAFASGSGVRVAAVAETAFGVAPATPSFQTLRTTSGGLRTTKSTGTSNERQSDRNVRDEFELGQDVTGSYDFEFTYGTFDQILAALMCSSWVGDVLKNGITPQSLTIEETYELGAADAFRRFSGCMINTMSLSIGARAAVTGSFGIMGRMEALAEAIVTGATYADPSETPVSTASANVAGLAIGSITPAPKVRSLTLDISNNLRTRPVVGSKFSEEFGLGRFDVSGTMECYFENKTLYQACLDHGLADLTLQVGNAGGDKYQFDIDKLRLGDGNVTAGGNDDDIMVSVPFRGLLGAEDCTLKITREVA